ncbi:MAG: ribonuclease J [Erysipelotrichaceae bacterium]|jgi:ribonuclease J|nr:ribonuclease J [Erysipelotrichaceae bacterium]
MESLSRQFSIYALGGLGEVGKNMYCVENQSSIIIIDCGVKFPGIELPGVDYVIPDFTHLRNNRNKVKALFITHGHEDHIGGIPFLVQSVNIPVIYAPKLAAALIKNRLEEFRISTTTKVVEYDDDTVVNLPDFKVSFFRVTHSIPDSFGVVVDTKEGRIVSTGDFKVDLTPVGPDINIHKMAKLGDEGVDLLLSDSTNAESEGYTPSEKNVLDSIEEIFLNANGRIIVSTFSSNVSRIQQIIEVAVKYKRKIAIAGRSMEKVVQISRDFGYIKVPDSSIIPTQDIKLFKNDELVILCTGSQGEPTAAMSRIANGEHKDISIKPGDTVVFSSSAIPGNEIMISSLINLLTRHGATILTNSILSDIHSSGHPCRQELRLVLKLLKPKYFMPMHGEYRMLRLHAELSEEMGVVEKGHSFILDNGDTLTLSNHKITPGYQVEHGVVYIDGFNIEGLNETVLQDRKQMTEDGMISIILSIDANKGELIVEPIIYTKGIISKHSHRAVDECRSLIKEAIKGKIGKKTNYNELKIIVKDVAEKYFYQITKRHPMIIPVIMAKKEE